MLTLRGFQGGNGWLWEIFRKDVSLRTSYNPCDNGFFVTSSRRMLVKGWFLANCSRPLCQEGNWSRTSRYFYQSWEQRVEQIREQSLILDVWSMRSTSLQKTDDVVIARVAEKVLLLAKLTIVMNMNQFRELKSVLQAIYIKCSDGLEGIQLSRERVS